MAGKERNTASSKRAKDSAIPAGGNSPGGTQAERGERGWSWRAQWGAGVWRYVMVAGVVGAATVLRWGLDPVLASGLAFVTYYPAVAVSALVGGARAGLVATVSSALAVATFFLEPRGSLSVESLGDWVALGLFGTAGGLMSWMAERVDRAHRREAEAAGLARGAEALRESEERYRSLFEHMLDGFAYCQMIYENGAPSDFLFLVVNNAFERLTGLKNVIGKRVSETIPGIHQSNPEFLQIYGRVALSGQPERFETYVEPMGIWFSIAVYSPEKDRFVAVFDNISERKRAEEALRESEERLRLVLEGVCAGVWAVRLEPEARYWSPEYRKLYSFGADEPALDETWARRVHPEDLARLRKRVRTELEQGDESGWRQEFRIQHPELGERWIESLVRVRRERTGRAVGFSGIDLDISERKAAEAVLARSKEELERLVAERTARLQEMVEELEHFSYTITHDLKAPLRAMRGFAEIVSLMCGDAIGKEPKEALGKIAMSAERMDLLIADALNYSRSLRQELPLTDVDTGALLRGMLDSYPQFQPAKAQIRVEGKLPVVLGNEAGLTQVFSNLLENAVKFVRAGEKPVVRVWAEESQPEVRSQKSEGNAKEIRSGGLGSGWVRIWVDDQGIGISREMLPRVFEMFSRASKGYEGTGIGLALVRKVTQRMGGRAGVESEEGKGSRFWIELRLGEARVFDERGGRPAFAEATARQAMVLYVEDEEDDAVFMQRAFAGQGLGSALRVVGDGRAAIEYLSGAGRYADRKEYPLPSVVLLDLNLPELPGFEVLKWMRNNPDFARTPVVVFSSSTRDDDRVKAEELGANEFVAKPSSGLKFGEVVAGLKEKWLG